MIRRLWRWLVDDGPELPLDPPCVDMGNTDPRKVWMGERQGFVLIGDEWWYVSPGNIPRRTPKPRAGGTFP